MTYLRFTPREYLAISVLCRPLDYDRYSAYALKWFLVGSLAAEWPELAARINRFTKEQLHLLRDHVRQLARPEEPPSLTPEEVELVVTTAGPLLFKARFMGPLKTALVKLLGEKHPKLAGKLARLSLAQFQGACERRRAV
jgi:hypothetical protein